jgi:GNAT superfamily N-acetyltransferase
MYLIRDAHQADIPNIIDGIKAFVAASSYKIDTVDPLHVENTLLALLNTGDGCVAVLETDDGAFSGCFIGMAHPHLFSGKRMLGELFIYTTPAARGHGGKLRRFAEEWARDRNCQTFCIAYPVSESHLEKVYRRWGFTPCETNWRKELN